MSKIITYEYVKSEFYKRKYELLESEYIDAHTKMRYKCLTHPDNIQEITWANFTQGKGCKQCAKERAASSRRTPYNIVKQAFEDRGYVLLETSYKNCNQKLRFLCPNHPHEETYITYRDLKDGCGCKFCVGQGTSFPEKFIYIYLKSFFNESINRHNEFGYEYDIYIPELQLYIEYDGELYHKNKSNDGLKEQACQNNNKHFLRIKETKNKNVQHYPSRSKNIIETYFKYGQKIDYMNKVVNEIVSFIYEEFHININFHKINNINEQILLYTQKVKQEKSLGVLRPDIAEEWDCVKNGNLTPFMFSEHSNYYAYWKCKKCGHEWQSTIGNRTGGHGKHHNQGCPVCNSPKKAVVQLSVDFEYINEFESLSSAAKAFHGTPSNIRAACEHIRNQYKAYGYRWMYKEDYEEWTRLKELKN